MNTLFLWVEVLVLFRWTDPVPHHYRRCRTIQSILEGRRLLLLGRLLGGRGFAGGEGFGKGQELARGEGLAWGGDRSGCRFRCWRVLDVWDGSGKVSRIVKTLHTLSVKILLMKMLWRRYSDEDALMTILWQRCSGEDALTKMFEVLTKILRVTMLSAWLDLACRSLYHACLHFSLLMLDDVLSLWVLLSVA